MDNQKTGTHPSAAAPAQPLTIPAEIHTFLEGLLEDAGMKVPSEEIREEMIKELYVRLDNYLTTVIIDNLPPQYLDAFIKMNEEGKEKAEIEKFLREKMPNSQNVFTKAFIEFRDMYLSGVTLAKTAPKEEKYNPADVKVN